MTGHVRTDLPSEAAGRLASEICTELSKIEDWLATQRTRSETLAPIG
jgi:hypothetical protein